MSTTTFFFRELDLKAFGILKCELVSCAVLDSEMNTEVCTEFFSSSPYQQLHKQSDLFDSILNSTFPFFLLCTGNDNSSTSSPSA